MNRRLVFVYVCALLLVCASAAHAGSDIVLRASDARNLHGNWWIGSDGSAAGGQYVGSTDYGWSVTDAPLAQPNDYFEVSFNAPANTPYHVWFRLRAGGNSKYNDSVWVQYSDARSSGGSSVYPIGTTSGLTLNLERCGGCGESGWGWQDGAYWLSQATTVQFASTGTHTIRVQIREDGVGIDQIVLSPATYLYASPGQMTGDTVIVPLSSGSTTTTTVATTAAATSAPGPYLGSPITLPGRVEAENFDNGGDGVSYHDTTSGNAGGAYRQTNADIEGCSEGGYDLGWIDAGEWWNYAVNVSSGGSYTVKLRVASLNGGWLHLGFNGPSNVWKSVQVPATGGWQNWTTVSVPVTLGGGSQLITLLADTAGFNINYIEVAAGTTTATTTTTATSSTSGGTSVPVVTWNLQINSGSSHAQQAMANLMTLNPKPQILVLEEFYGPLWNTYIAELQARTGLTWQGVFKSHCPLGAWNGSSCTSSEDEGVAVLTSLPIISSSSTLLPYADQWHSARALVRVAVNVGGVTLQVFGTHLQPNNSGARYSSMSVIKSYAGNYSSPQILAGDFNADMDQIDTTSGMYPNFNDTWKLVGSGNGFTAFTPSPSMKIDYWFADAGGRAKPDWTVVLTNFGTFSDHFPVMASFTVK
ncbi:MAG: carbohydrate-binding protein [Bacteroidales bacterium]